MTDPKVEQMERLADALLNAGSPLMRDMDPIVAVDTVISVLFFVAEQASIEPQDLLHRVKIAAHHYALLEEPTEYEA